VSEQTDDANIEVLPMDLSRERAMRFVDGPDDDDYELIEPAPPAPSPSPASPSPGSAT
jgi:hypothetical protein